MNYFGSVCRNWMKIGVICQLIVCLFVSSAAETKATAETASFSTNEAKEVRIYINGISYPGRAVLHENTTYIELGEFTDEIRPATRAIGADGASASYTAEALEIRVRHAERYMVANDRYLWCEKGVFVQEGETYVPLRAAAKALGADVRWNETEFAAYIATGDTPILSGDTYYDKDAVFWLSRIIESEAGMEPFRGKMAVGNVILNRTRHTDFPDTIYSVIFDRNYGVQFTPTANGTIYCTPREDSVIAAKLCLEGYTLSSEILYFLNPRLSTSFWVPNNREYIMTIAGHDFYS